jgi:ubiquinol-cytochrome c reductase cytochrome c subunit
MRVRRFVCSWLCAVSVAGVRLAAQAAAPAQPASIGNAQAGKDLYLRYSCYACHGYDGHGGAGARLVPTRMTAERFTAYVRNPRQMPPYTTKLLSDAQVGDLWAFVKSLPVSPDARDIPLLAGIMRGR